MKIGDNIKNQLRARGMSIPDLEKKTGLTTGDIKNLLYNKSKNIENLEAIAKAFNVPLVTLMPTVLLSPFDYRTYTLSVNVVHKNFDSLSISTTKEMFDEYVTQMYNYIATNKDRSEKEVFVYCEGMLRNAINMGAPSIQAGKV